VRSGETQSGLAWLYQTTTNAIRESQQYDLLDDYSGKAIIPLSP
jgi:hypothetical protein